VSLELRREIIGNRRLTPARAHELQGFAHGNDSQPAAQIAATAVV
jgi:hypothetical protein